MGGGVKGGQILGKYPETLKGGPEILDRGRVIPTTSWDVIFHSIAEWAGVAPEELIKVIPNIGNFPDSSFSASDLFEDTQVNQEFE